MKISTVNGRQTHVSPVQGHDRNERADEETFLSASVGTIAHSLGERALMVTLAHQTDFSEMMSLAVHPEAKHGLALRLRTLCRRALPLGSSLHRRLCWKLLRHSREEVREHIVRLISYEGPTVWRAGGRAESEITGGSTARGRDEHHWTECECDPVRDVVETEMLPYLSHVLDEEGFRRWLLPLRSTIWICQCGSFYTHLWSEALIVVLRHRRALRTYLHDLYSRLSVAEESERLTML